MRKRNRERKTDSRLDVRQTKYKNPSTARTFSWTDFRISKAEDMKPRRRSEWMVKKSGVLTEDWGGGGRYTNCQEGWGEKREKKGIEDSWAVLSGACSLTDSTWLTGMPGPSGRNGVLGWRVPGVMQTTHDLQWKGSCHSWNTHINKVLAESRYLPSSSNKYPCSGCAWTFPSNCHKYIHWRQDYICGNILEITFNSHTKRV